MRKIFNSAAIFQIAWQPSINFVLFSLVLTQAYIERWVYVDGGEYVGTLWKVDNNIAILVYIYVLSYSNNNIKYFLITIFEHSSYFFFVFCFNKQQSNVYRKGAYIVFVKIQFTHKFYAMHVEFFLNALIKWRFP